MTGISRKDLAAGYALAARFVGVEEGYRSYAYRDVVGVWTIGYGRTYNRDGSRIRPGQKTTRAAELVWFQGALRKYAAGIVALDVELTPRMFAALLSLSYNLGPGVITDTGTFEIARDLKAHRWDQVGDDFDRYANPSVLRGRRNREQEMYFRGLANLKRRRERSRAKACRRRRG